MANNNNNKQWLYILLLFSFIFLFYKGIKSILNKATTNSTSTNEGFTQDAPFVLKQDDAIDDDFYIPFYREMTKKNELYKNEITDILTSTQASPELSVILVVGSTTGNEIEYLHDDKGYTEIMGVHHNNRVVGAQAQDQQQQQLMMCADVCADPMLFDRKTFTHILCLGTSLQHMKDDDAFFKNARQWLCLGGYLAIRCVTNPKEFLLPTTTNHSKTEFMDFSYKVDIEPTATATATDKTLAVLMKETFINQQGQVRENERTFILEPPTQLVEKVARRGFTPKGEFKYKNGTVVYLFQR